MTRAHQSRPTAVPWRPILRWALFAAIVTTAIVAGAVVSNRAGAVSLVAPGRQGPSAAAIRKDFPDARLEPGVGLDGQQYYAVARGPFHLRSDATELDRPRYRLQRPLFPFLAWILDPVGRGTGLVVALAAVGVVALVLGGVATGVLSVTLGGSPALAAVFALLPGAYFSLRYSLADTLALALAVAALAASARDRHRTAIVLAVLAVLAKETAVVLFVGWALARRTRGRAGLVVVPVLVAAAWAGFLALWVPAGQGGSDELGLPFVGLVHAATRIWGDGQQLFGMLCTVSALALAAVALQRYRLRHALSWVLVTGVAFVSVMGSNVVGMDFGSSRSMMPIHLMAILALGTGAARTARTARPTEVSAFRAR